MKLRTNVKARFDDLIHSNTKGLQAPIQVLECGQAARKRFSPAGRSQASFPKGHTSMSLSTQVFQIVFSSNTPGSVNDVPYRNRRHSLSRCFILPLLAVVMCSGAQITSEAPSTPTDGTSLHPAEPADMLSKETGLSAMQSTPSLNDCQVFQPCATIWDEAKFLGKKAKQLSGFFSDAKSAVDIALALGKALGVIGDDTQKQFDALHAHLDQIALEVTWQMSLFWRDHYLGQVISAVDTARITPGKDLCWIVTEFVNC
jgi:hypothetical protein